MKLKRKIRRAENSVRKDIIEDDGRELLTLNEDFNNICEKAETIALISRDYKVNNVGLNNFMYYNEGTDIIRFIADERVYNKDISSYAMSQLCNKIGVPYQYMKRCAKTGKNKLVETNINSWINVYNKDLFIRECNNKIRGILTPRYSVFDTHEILDVLGEEFPIKDYRIKGYFLSPERFHIRFVSHDMLRINGEDLFPGISVDSSDVGRSHLRLNFFIWKQVCTNGLIIPKKFGSLMSKRHMGMDKFDFREELRKSLDMVEPLIAKVTESINNTMTFGLEDTFKEKDSLQKLIDDISKNMGVSDDDAEKVVELVRTEVYPMNRWGMINAITEVAQNYTLEKRIEIEKNAGELLIAA